MSTQLTLLDRGLGFRIDAEATVSDEDVGVITDQFGQANCHRFRYGICDFTHVNDVILGPSDLNPVMRIFLQVVEACPDMFFALVGHDTPFGTLERYRPLFRELPWVTHRCATVDEAMSWISENMSIKYGMYPDFVRTIPLAQQEKRD